MPQISEVRQNCCSRSASVLVYAEMSLHKVAYLQVRRVVLGEVFISGQLLE